MLVAGVQDGIQEMENSAFGSNLARLTEGDACGMFLALKT